MLFAIFGHDQFIDNNWREFFQAPGVSELDPRNKKTGEQAEQCGNSRCDIAEPQHGRN